MAEHLYTVGTWLVTPVICSDALHNLGVILWGTDRHDFSAGLEQTAEILGFMDERMRQQYKATFLNLFCFLHMHTVTTQHIGKL